MDIFGKIGMQFKKPSGFTGKIVSNLMIMGNRFAYEILIKELSIHSNDKLLEIGYGPGLVLPLAHDRDIKN